MNVDYQYKYARDFDENAPKLLEYLFNGGKDRKIIKKMCYQGLSLIDQKYDCSDFRIEIFTRILYGYKNIIGKEVEDLITKSLFNFPFEDDSCHSMCTWTENHQLIIYVSEYLLGNLYPNAKFYKGILGKDLAKGAYARLNEWCDFIYRFGFSEFGSCNYYPETLGALGNIIEFANDEELVNKFKIVLDLMLYDIFSSATPDLTYNKATARAYVDNKINYYNYLKPHIKALLNKDIKVNHEREACFFLMVKHKKYQLPKVFLDIFNTKEKELKESNGLNANEYKKNGLLTDEDKNVRYIMTSGTSNSYVALRNVSKYLTKKKMWNHSMFSNAKHYKNFITFAPISFNIIQKLNNKKLDSIASYARGNTYTYVKNNYSVSSLTRYQVNKLSFQQVTHMVNLDGLSVFSTAPARPMDQLGSPSYWVGSKKNPDCIQYQNTLIAFYHNTTFTHLFFPVEKFDEVNLDELDKGLIFARYHSINLFIRTNEHLLFTDSTNDKTMKQDEKMPHMTLKQYDLVNIHRGDHYYVFEVDDTLSFASFIKKIKSNLPKIYKKSIFYKGLNYTFNKPSYYNKQLIPTSYSRYESQFVLNGKYTYSKNKPLTFISKKHKLTINFNSFTRTIK